MRRKGKPHKLYYDYGYGNMGFGCYLWRIDGYGEIQNLMGFIPDIEVKRKERKFVW